MSILLQAYKNLVEQVTIITTTITTKTKDGEKEKKRRKKNKQKQTAVPSLSQLMKRSLEQIHEALRNEKNP